MYFEPSQKTYYRFPSTHSIHDLDSKYYFPEKSTQSVENSIDANITGSFPKRETSNIFNDVKGKF